MSETQVETEDQVETKRDRFRRLAVQRGENLKKYARLMINLAGPGYDYSEADAKKVVDPFFSLAHEAKAAFERKYKPKTDKFDL